MLPYASGVVMEYCYKYLTYFQVDLASYHLTDMVLSSFISSNIVYVANGDDTETVYVISSTLIHYNKNPVKLMGRQIG